MKRIILLSAFILVCFVFAMYPADAQLIIHNAVHKIKKVDLKKNRLEVENAESPNPQNVMYVLIDNNTVVNMHGKQISWTQLKPGMIIRVEGGVQFDIHIKAKKIWVK